MHMCCRLCLCKYFFPFSFNIWALPSRVPKVGRGYTETMHLQIRDFAVEINGTNTRYVISYLLYLEDFRKRIAETLD